MENDHIKTAPRVRTMSNLHVRRHWTKRFAPLMIGLYTASGLCFIVALVLVLGLDLD